MAGNFSSDDQHLQGGFQEKSKRKRVSTFARVSKRDTRPHPVRIPIFESRFWRSCQTGGIYAQLWVIAIRI